MSDIDSDSDNNSDNESDVYEEEIMVPSNKPVLLKIHNNLKPTDNADDSDPEDDADNEIEGEDDDADDSEDDDVKLPPTQTNDVSDDDEDDDYAGGSGSDDDDDADPDDDVEIDENGETSIKSSKLKKTKIVMEENYEEDDEDDDEQDETYLQKFDNEIIKNYVNDFHPECLNHNYDEISKLSIVVRNADGIIIDPLHKTSPYLTKYEKARILGQRAKQIETGAKPLVKVSESIIDGYIIAELELREKKIPFIIRRPIPGGGCEYWSLRDLEVIAF